MDAARHMRTKVGLVLLSTVVAAGLPAAVTASSKTTAGALNMNARLVLIHRPPGVDPGQCPPQASSAAASRVMRECTRVSAP